MEYIIVHTSEKNPKSSHKKTNKTKTHNNNNNRNRNENRIKIEEQMKEKKENSRNTPDAKSNEHE